MHQMQVILLTDAISLSLLHRQKYHNSRLLEISIYLGHFENLSIHYVCGPSLFFADLISRQYNEVHLQNSPDLNSKEWSELLPAMNLRNVGVTLTAGSLMTWGSSFYKQNTVRYFNLKTEDLQNTVPKEISFLADLYSGWDNKEMSAETFFEAEKALTNFPAAALAKKFSNKNLISLRKKLFDLNIHEKLMTILGGKVQFR